MKKAQTARSTRRKETDTGVSESFRRARGAVDQITTDLEQLRRRAATLVKHAHRSSK